MTLVRRWQQLVAWGLWGLVILLIGSYVGVGVTAGQEPHYAGLVIAFPEGRVESSCVQFEEDEISGAELLRSSGLSVVLSGFGGLGEGVCQIDGTGCSDPGNCFCQCRGADCASWSYYSLEDGDWRFENSGASQRRLQHGDVDGWVWGNGRTPPPEASFAEICPLAAAPADDSPPPPGPTTVPSGGASDSDDHRPAVSQDNNEAPSGADEPSTMPTAGQDRETPEASAAPTSRAHDGRQVVGDGQPPDAGGETAASPDEDDGGGAPVGLIAFGAVAGALIAAIGGLALRRRISG